MQGLKNGYHMSFFKTIKVGGRKRKIDKITEVRKKKFKIFFNKEGWERVVS